MLQGLVQRRSIFGVAMILCSKSKCHIQKVYFSGEVTASFEYTLLCSRMLAHKRSSGDALLFQINPASLAAVPLDLCFVERCQPSSLNQPMLSWFSISMLTARAVRDPQFGAQNKCQHTNCGLLCE